MTCLNYWKAETQADWLICCLALLIFCLHPIWLSDSFIRSFVYSFIHSFTHDSSVTGLVLSKRCSNILTVTFTYYIIHWIRKPNQMKHFYDSVQMWSLPLLLQSLLVNFSISTFILLSCSYLSTDDIGIRRNTWQPNSLHIERPTPKSQRRLKFRSSSFFWCHICHTFYCWLFSSKCDINRAPYGWDKSVTNNTHCVCVWVCVRHIWWT